MIVRVLNENFKIINMIKKYVFVQYTNKCREVGTFNLQVTLENENLYLLDKTKTYYILFDNYVIGKVEDAKKQSETESNRVIDVSGRMILYILKKRVLYRTMEFRTKTYKAIDLIIRSNLVDSTNINRNIVMDMIYDNDMLDLVCSDIDKSITGGYVWDGIEELLEYDRLCINIVPVVERNHFVDGTETNISEWKCLISAGTDRRKGNVFKNPVVMFSQSLSNISRAEYDYDKKESCNVAYIAGSGEGSERRWYEKFVTEEAKEKTGFDRNELWIDARDISDLDELGEAVPDEEYEEKINKRASEKLSVAVETEQYESTVIENEKQYVYNRDFFLGDWVTVKDDEIGVVLDAQVTGVTVSFEGSRKIVDIELTYGSRRKNIIDRTSYVMLKQEENSTNIKYLENLIKSGAGTGTGGGSGTATVSVKVLSTETLEPGTSAYVKNAGNEQNVQLIFGVPQGAKGEQGRQGEQGEQGQKGDTGETGPAGPQGEPGKDGIRGPAGPQGEPGRDGKDGESIVSVEQIVESEEPGGVNVIRITLSTGEYTDIRIRNGTGGGSVIQPTGDYKTKTENNRVYIDKPDGTFIVQNNRMYTNDQSGKYKIENNRLYKEV